MSLKDQFIPHAGNQYQPHILQQAAMLGMLVLIVLSFAIANLHSLLWISSDWLISTILPSVIVVDTNEEREDQALPELTRNPILDYAAQLKANDMVANQYFAHYSPTGVSPWYWFSQAGYGFIHAGENLAVHFTDSGEVVKAWMNSPTHRANILNTNFTEIGIGVAEGTFEGYKTVFVVQLFATPAGRTLATPRPVVAEASPTEAVAEPAGPPAVQVAGVEQSAEINDEEESDTDVTADADFVATSVPAGLAEPQAFKAEPSPASWWVLATQPQTLLQILYAIIGLFVIGALLLSILIEIRRQHPVQVVYGAGLMATMWCLFYLHVALTSGVTIL